MKTVLFSLFLLPVTFSFASVQSLLPLQDTIIPQKEYELTRNEFLKKYGCDDSSRALIQFYFDKRNLQKRTFYAGAALAAIAGIAYFPVNNMPEVYSTGEWLSISQKESYLIILTAIAYTAVPFILSGGILWVRYSRSRLLNLLNNYFNGKSIPKGMSRNRIFRGYLQYGEWNLGVKKLIKANDAYKKSCFTENGQLKKLIYFNIPIDSDTQAQYWFAVQWCDACLPDRQATMFNSIPAAGSKQILPYFLTSCV